MAAAYAAVVTKDYNLNSMDTLLSVLAPVLEVLFFVGLAGSAVVIVISFIEDIRTIGSDQPSNGAR